jgi:hypothetical protein
VEQVVLGLYFMRGDNMCAPCACTPRKAHAAHTPSRAETLPLFCSPSQTRSAVVGELDEDLDANLDLSAITAAPLKMIS